MFKINDRTQLEIIIKFKLLLKIEGKDAIKNGEILIFSILKLLSKLLTLFSKLKPDSINSIKIGKYCGNLLAKLIEPL